MNHAGLLRSALVALTRNKLRSLLTFAGITIALPRLSAWLPSVWIEAGGSAILSLLLRFRLCFRRLTSGPDRSR